METTTESVVTLTEALNDLLKEKLIERVYNYERLSQSHVLCPVYFMESKIIAQLLYQERAKLVSDKWHRFLIELTGVARLAYLDPTVGGFMISQCQQCSADAARTNDRRSL